MIDLINKTSSIVLKRKEIKFYLSNKTTRTNISNNNLSKYDGRLSTKDENENNFSKSISEKLKKGQWSIQEDELLKEWVKNHGPCNWKKCGEFIQFRNGKQCREHWKNCLSPDLLKTQWNSKEEFLIFYAYETCKGSWKEIVKLFDGRTENSIKNRFFSRLRKIASKYMNNQEKKFCPKSRLNYLKPKYFNEAYIESKKELLIDYPMNEEEFLAYLSELDYKISMLKTENRKYVKEYDEDKSNLDDTYNTNLTSKYNEEEDNVDKPFNLNKINLNYDVNNQNMENNLIYNTYDTSNSLPSINTLLIDNILSEDKSKEYFYYSNDTNRDIKNLIKE